MNYIKEYWPQIIAICGFLLGMIKFAISMIEATKCSLRNDILEIYDNCKEKNEITKWQLEAILHSYKVYKALNGNSFVKSLVERVETFKVVD